MSIPFLDLRSINLRFESEYLDALRGVLSRGWFVQGTELETFESEFAQACGSRHCIGVGNGLDALSLILRAYMELGRLLPGDEVILPANTFIATALAVSHAGLTPVLVDPDPRTANLAPEAAAAAVGPRTRVLLPVHLYGRLADMAAFRTIADRHGLILVEDAAQAHGAQRAGRAAGSWGDAAGFSFFPGKNLGALGDGGAVVTGDGKLAACIRALRSYGSERKYHHPLKGFNSRLDELQAAFLRIRLRALSGEVAERSAIAAHYSASIHNPHITLPALPQENHAHAWHLYVVRTPHRAALQRHLSAAGVESLAHYPVPIHRQPAYADSAWPVLPVAEAMAASVLSLPLYPGLPCEAQERIIAACNGFSP